MAELVFFAGTMDSGKSTLALQMDYNYRRRGLHGLVFSTQDRAGQAVLSSRLGLAVEAVEAGVASDFWTLLVERRTRGERIDYLICDEAQFYSREQVEQLARVVDEMGVAVYAFGITTDFRTHLFPGSARFIELADRTERLQVESLCWCGRRATHNARTIDGRMVTSGEQIVVGDTTERGGAQPVGEVSYEVLCRAHHLHRTTAAAAQAAELSPETLPLY